MRTLKSAAVMAALLGSFVVFPAPGIAAPLSSSAANALMPSEAQSHIIDVQFQGRGGPRGGPGLRGGPRGGGRFVGGGGRRWGGPGVGAGVAIGVGTAIIGGMIAADQARAAAEQDAMIAACARRFRSYDPMTMTYVGRGGQTYRCP